MTSNGRQVADALRTLAQEYPREFPRALSAVGLGLRKRMKVALPKGSPPLSFRPWNSFTRLLKFGRKNLDRLHRSGYFDPTRGLKRKKNGELTKGSENRLARRRIRLNKQYHKLASAESKFGYGGKIKDFLYYHRKGSGSGASVDVGYRNDRLGKYANAFQTPESHPLTKEERHFRHKIQGESIDGTYNRPARPFIEPFATDPVTQQFIIDAVKKNISARAAKAAKKAQQSAAMVRQAVTRATSRQAFAASFRP